MLDQHFNPNTAEPEIYQRWEEAGCFKPSGDTSAEAYSIVIPPPNVTGVLHMGHALNNTLQDVLIRFNRMLGKNVLWQPGADHAGIATQMVVERQLAEEGNPDRRSMGREAFIERVWDWKETSGGKIQDQLKRLGASCDWSRDKFTMGERGAEDDQMVAAVRRVFVDLYNEGLIYRDKRLVNWDPHFQTAISDLEVENREVEGCFWHFKYPLEGGETYEYVEKDEDGNVVFQEARDYISIATTRPETMLGDGAVAVHPGDERYAPIVGKMVRLPLADRLIPVIADEHPDPGFGSGAVKITGAHDFNDYEVAKRHGLPMYALMDERGAMKASDIMPEKYVGMDRFEAREAVVADIDAEGLLIEVEDKKIMQPFGDRSGVVIEPMLTDQWYVDAKTLAKPAIEAVKRGATRFVPENWAKTYFNWMEDIQPWCVSRQLWWGHRIPVWYGPTLKTDLDEDGKTPAADRLSDDAHPKKVFCANDLAGAIAEAGEYYGSEFEVFCDARKPRGHGISHIGGTKPHWINLYQDEDVLDTWFSSALWPFSTQGWPNETEQLKTFYPGTVLVTAFDIIFFWVARMMMQGLHFMDGVAPFKDVYIHALVLDEKGQKMSKSKGNAMDPLELIDEYGADALRFTMAAMAAQGRNIRLSKQRVEGYRNFGTKLWNAAKFVQMNECRAPDGLDPSVVHQPVNRWIIAECARTADAVRDGIESYKFNEAAAAAYRFIWNVYCDWYLELIKPLLNGEDEDAKAETRAVASWTLDQTLKLLHPFMPFITEALWERDGPRDGFLIGARWPAIEGAAAPKAEAEMDWVIRFITEIRSARGILGVPPGEKPSLSLVNANKTTRERLARHSGVVQRLARLGEIRTADAPPEGSVATVLDEASLCLNVAGLIDPAAEGARLDKEIKKLDGEITGIEKKLGNENFVSRAPAEVVEEQHARKAEAEGVIEKLRAARARLAEMDA